MFGIMGTLIHKGTEDDLQVTYQQSVIMFYVKRNFLILKLSFLNATCHKIIKYYIILNVHYYFSLFFEFLVSYFV